MASSSTNPPKESDNQDNKSNQSSETFVESKKILPTSSSNVESPKINRRHVQGTCYES